MRNREENPGLSDFTFIKSQMEIALMQMVNRELRLENIAKMKI